MHSSRIFQDFENSQNSAQKHTSTIEMYCVENQVYIVFVVCTPIWKAWNWKHRINSTQPNLVSDRGHILHPKNSLCSSFKAPPCDDIWYIRTANTYNRNFHVCISIHGHAGTCALYHWRDSHVSGTVDIWVVECWEWLYTKPVQR
jgi:hypothetical protein